MLLVERHIIGSNHPFFEECDDLCFRSKNVYNQGLYNVRQHFFGTGSYLSYVDNYHINKAQESYAGLPAKVACQTLKLVDQNFKSFFGALKAKKSGSNDRPVRIPKYKNKASGRMLVKFPKQALELREFKKSGRIKLSKSNILVPTQIKDFDSINEVRIAHGGDHCVIEVVYERQEAATPPGNAIASLDPGMNNLATVTFNDGSQPAIINGRPAKSINQFYNKTKAQAVSDLHIKQGEDIYTSKRIKRLTHKRNNKISDYMHKASRLLVDLIVSRNVGRIVIGKNVEQKQDINIGKKNNQNFVQMPIARFLDMVAYKCQLVGIEVEWQEESYTSKASFLDLDAIPVYSEEKEGKHSFSGYRESRSWYKRRGVKKRVHADVNGAYNIMRKAIPTAFDALRASTENGIEDVGVRPAKIGPYSGFYPAKRIHGFL